MLVISFDFNEQMNSFIPSGNTQMHHPSQSDTLNKNTEEFQFRFFGLQEHEELRHPSPLSGVAHGDHSWTCSAFFHFDVPNELQKYPSHQHYPSHLTPRKWQQRVGGLPLLRTGPAADVTGLQACIPLLGSTFMLSVLQRPSQLHI